MRLTTWAVLSPLGCCLVLGYACCRGLHDPVTIALYHLFAYWALIGSLLVVVCALLDALDGRGKNEPPDARDASQAPRRRRFRSMV